MEAIRRRLGDSQLPKEGVARSRFLLARIENLSYGWDAEARAKRKLARRVVERALVFQQN
jgi:hypothetical protein